MKEESRKGGREGEKEGGRGEVREVGRERRKEGGRKTIPILNGNIYTDQVSALCV